MRLGVHCSIAGGLDRALEEARGKGCETIQVFTRSPRNWAGKPIPEAEAAAFRAGLAESGISPLVVHTIYLPNLATEQEALYEKSVQVFMDDMRRAEAIGANYLVIHPGRHSGGTREVGMRRLIAGLNRALREVTNNVLVLIENLAGGKTDLCARFEEIGAVRAGLETPARVGVCLDTAHAHAAGYDVTSAAGWDGTLAAFDRAVGLDHLKGMHVNDSKAPRGGAVDRHEHIGKGFIGLEGFRAMVNHPRLRDIPMILETPKKTVQDDPENLRTIRQLAVG